MALAKEGKIFPTAQQEAVLAFLASTRYPGRDRVIFLLSVRPRLRAMEIAALKWEMLTGAEGELSCVIALTNEGEKGGLGGRGIPIAKELGAALLV